MNGESMTPEQRAEEIAKIIRNLKQADATLKAASRSYPDSTVYANIHNAIEAAEALTALPVPAVTGDVVRRVLAVVPPPFQDADSSSPWIVVGWRWLGCHAQQEYSGALSGAPSQFQFPSTEGR